MPKNEWIKTIVLFAVFCSASSLIKAQLADIEATPETKALDRNLKVLANKGIMFGHQDNLAYGVGWKYQKGKSDVKDVTGDYPAVYGWDLGGIENGSENNLDQVPFSKMKKYIKESYQKGAINTISWHLDNPRTGGSSWDTTKAVALILPGGKEHELYTQWLDRAAKFFKDLKGQNGEYIPILFRPFHELNGGWFWWGAPNCSKEEYISLWKFTVDYLKNEKDIHHLIYVYNTNSFRTAEEFMDRYPGDHYADILSFDAYQFSSPEASAEAIKKSSLVFNKELKNSLAILDSIARKHQKLAALAETGFEAILDENWWTATLWDAIKDYKISYVLLWRNHGWQEKEQKMHYYVPYPGQKSEEDFRQFYKLKATFFEKDIIKENLYK